MKIRRSSLRTSVPARRLLDACVMGLRRHGLVLLGLAMLAAAVFVVAASKDSGGGPVPEDGGFAVATIGDGSDTIHCADRFPGTAHAVRSNPIQFVPHAVNGQNQQSRYSSMRMHLLPLLLCLAALSGVAKPHRAWRYDLQLIAPYFCKILKTALPMRAGPCA